MATDQRNIISLIDTDAKFRTWGSAVAAQLLACGLVQTSDTGQINWTTVAIPAAGSVGGYEIWKFNDALQTAKPVFIKVEYGRTGGSNTNALWFTVGTITDGAGNLSGQTFPRFLCAGSNTLADGVQLPSYCSGDGSRIGLVTNLKNDNATYARALIVDRTRDEAGVATGDGVLCWAYGGSSAAQCGLIPFLGPVPAVIANAPAIPMTGMQSKVGSDVVMEPWVAANGRALSILQALTYVHADITELASFTATHLGASHTFMPLGDGIRENGAAFATATGRTIALLWE